MNTTGWLKGLRVTGDGTEIVSHAAVALLRALADKTGLTAGPSKRWPAVGCWFMTGDRCYPGLACAIADGADVISDFRVIGDLQELFGPVASVPTCWRTLEKIAAGGSRSLACDSRGGLRSRARPIPGATLGATGANYLLGLRTHMNGGQADMPKGPWLPV